MEILHLSDLHVTEADQTYQTCWGHAASALVDRKFDFIIVSGDLTQRAAAAEYTQLEQFVVQSLLPRLKVKDRARVVLVPGNHDVQWLDGKDDIVEPFRLASISTPSDVDSLKTSLETLKWTPNESDLRLSVGAYGHMEILKLKPVGEYVARFKNVHESLGRFYGSVLRDGNDHRPFDLLDPTGSGDWSAHIFREEGVAFFGFSSCSRNDKYWHGAHIKQTTIDEARRYAETRANNLLRVAVWHHGLSSDLGRPDHLTLKDIAGLSDAGFQVGFHGHIHDATFDVMKLLNEQLALVSTGSLGAGKKEREDTVGRQFTVASLFPTRLSVEVFESNKDGQYRINSERYRRVSIPARPVSKDATRNPRSTVAEHHSRTWTITPDGHAFQGNCVALPTEKPGVMALAFGRSR
jgi:predicted phosphodiesterase